MNRQEDDYLSRSFLSITNDGKNFKYQLFYTCKMNNQIEMIF
ncbi:hypothetical protein [Acholeplasma hippikon]|nr:hypothetical protein [Acholeplasma hippikon]